MVICADLHATYGERPLRVMVVDGQDIFRRKIRDILHGIGGFQVVAETASCRMALETVTRVQIDLVIAEFTLADGDGIALTTCLKELALPPRVIIFATAMHDPALLQAILAGADGYLVKDMSTRDIVKAFKNFERGGPAMQLAVTAHAIHLLVEQCKVVGAPLVSGLARDTSAPDPLLISHVPGDDALCTRVPASGMPFADGVTTPPQLSPQEEKVLTLLRKGQRNKQIAAQLAISPYTVGKHVQNILRKLGVANRTQAAAYTSFEG